MDVRPEDGAQGVPGVPYPAHLHPEAVRLLRRSFALNPGDVAVCTFPKCGTTWMQQIVLLLLRGGEPLPGPPRLAKRSPWLERLASTLPEPSLGALEAAVARLRLSAAPQGGRCVFKTHARPRLVPWMGGPSGAGGGRVIIVSREPKAAAVSAFHHSQGLPPPLRFRGSQAHFLEAWAGGLCTFGGGDFWSWHAEWAEAYRDLPGCILWVTFEGLKRDLPGEVARIAAFLDVPAKPGDEIVRRVANAAGFEAMRVALTAEEDAAAEAGNRFVRRGRVREGRTEGWRDGMSVAEAARIDAITRERFGSNAFLLSKVMCGGVDEGQGREQGTRVGSG